MAAAVEWRRQRQSRSGGAAAAPAVEVGALVVTVLSFLLPVSSWSTPPLPTPLAFNAAPPLIAAAAAAAVTGKSSTPPLPPPGVLCGRDVSGERSELTRKITFYRSTKWTKDRPTATLCS